MTLGSILGMVMLDLVLVGDLDQVGMSALAGDTHLSVLDMATVTHIMDTGTVTAAGATVRGVTRIMVITTTTVVVVTTEIATVYVQLTLQYVLLPAHLITRAWVVPLDQDHPERQLAALDAMVMVEL